MAHFLALPALAAEVAATLAAAALTPLAFALGPVRILGPPKCPRLAALAASLARAVGRASQQLERCLRLPRVDVALSGLGSSAQTSMLAGASEEAA
eukprot:6382945-Alexandrium_andersonii.AAC.1